MSNPDISAGPPADRRRPGEVRMTDTGEAEIFDGAGWRPLASLAQDPDTGDRQADKSREPQKPSDEGKGTGESEDTVSPP